ncbi:MAG: glycosyltransferase family A protein [Treponema sp.]|uniref:glycosyltransferase family A protein n=1 Tax=Treponema sp. TaxID=166 RepID=UPI003FA26446
MKDVIALYNQKRSVFAKNQMPCIIRKPAAFLHKPVYVVIPACGEYPGILSAFKSLNALEEAPAIICVVNHRASACTELKENNRTLVREAVKYGVCILDCTEGENEFKEGEGVGTARRIGMDYALLSGAKVIACMDADTLVSSSYGKALYDFFLQGEAHCRYGKNPPAGAVTDFTHQAAENCELQKAIETYEFFIKEHSRRLFKTGTPFYPYALGPSIVSSAWGYAASGGMNRRISGEDFYFLQSLIKIQVQSTAASEYGTGLKKRCFTFPVLDCTVFPQARLSERTLFGTGQKLAALTQKTEAHKQGESVKNSSLLYPDKVYAEITQTIALFYEMQNKSLDFLSECARRVPDVYDFFIRERFSDILEKITIQNRGKPERLEAAFHTWFDGLKILRLIHYLMR